MISHFPASSGFCRTGMPVLPEATKQVTDRLETLALVDVKYTRWEFPPADLPSQVPQDSRGIRSCLSLPVLRMPYAQFSYVAPPRMAIAEADSFRQRLSRQRWDALNTLI